MSSLTHRWLTRLGALLLAAQTAGHAENWPQWRGPFFNGSTSETNLPARLDPLTHRRWATPLPGRSGATPVIWGDAVFLPSPDEQKNLWLFCLDRLTGQVRWRQQVASGDRVVGKNNMASCSAVTDGRRVCVLFGTSDAAAYDLAGQPLWRRRLADDYGAFSVMFLYGANPLLFGDGLYVPLLQRHPPVYEYAKDAKPDRRSWLICLDPATGQTRWQQERPTQAREEAMEAYTTPIPFAGAHGPELILVGADCVTAHHPATGAELWRYAGLNRRKNPGGRIVPSPVTGPGLVFAIGPKREQLLALRPEGAGPLDESRVAWRTEQQIPDVSTPLYYQGKLFVLDGDRQVMNCYEPASGKSLGQTRLGVREIFYSSPTGADGKIYCFSEEGTLVVLSAGDSLKVLSTTTLGEGPCMASVAISQGQFFLRTARNLHCLGTVPERPVTTP